MKTKQAPAREIAADFIRRCRADGWMVDVRGQTVTIIRDFAPGDKSAFCECDATAWGLLASLPGRGGSTWGTDGGSVGGHVALTHGRYTLNRSCVGKRVADALALAHLFGLDR
jgi:hypothetical protein